MRILHIVDRRFGQTLGGKGDPTTALSIDECFGSLDAESLDIAIDALENLQSRGQSVNVISDLEALKKS